MRSLAVAAALLPMAWTPVYAHSFGDLDYFKVALPLSHTDGWIFGATNPPDDGDGPSRPTAVRWDGHSWRRVAMPREEGGIVRASASAPDNVWALGTAETGSYVLRFDGKRWRHARRIDANVQDIAALGKHHVWVFGTCGLNWFFNGWQWRVKRLPFDVNDLSVVAQNDVWAAAQWNRCGSKPAPALVHFDGRRWTRVPLSADLRKAYLVGVLKLGRDVWVFGEKGESGVAARWDGRVWTRVSLPAGWRPFDVSADGAGRFRLLVTSDGDSSEGDSSEAVLTGPAPWKLDVPTMPGKGVHLLGIGGRWVVGEFHVRDQGGSTSVIFQR
jgi:hypothetical protein